MQPSDAGREKWTATSFKQQTILALRKWRQTLLSHRVLLESQDMALDRRRVIQELIRKIETPKSRGASVLERSSAHWSQT
jgi:hypothetical protein